MGPNDQNKLTNKIETDLQTQRTDSSQRGVGLGEKGEGIKQNDKKPNLADTGNSAVTTRGKGAGGGRRR